MIARRVLALVAGLALLGGATLARDDGDGSSSPSWRDERLAEVRRLQQASEDDLRGLSEWDIAFERDLEDVPTAICSADLGEGCRRLERFGFDLRIEDPWVTAAAARDGGIDADVWAGPAALVEVAGADGRLVVGRPTFVDSRVAGATRAGSDVAEACEGSGTPLTCLVSEADRVATPDPSSSIAGTAVLVALAREAGGTGPDHLAGAVALLAGAQVTNAPISELLEVGLPDGEVALGTDAPVAAAVYGLEEDEDPPPVEVRWSRTADSLPVVVAADPDHPQIHRIRALLRSDSLLYGFGEAGFLELGDPWIDDEGPLADRPVQPAPVAASDLEAARLAWEAR